MFQMKSIYKQIKGLLCRELTKIGKFFINITTVLQKRKRQDLQKKRNN